MIKGYCDVGTSTYLFTNGAKFLNHDFRNEKIQVSCLLCSRKNSLEYKVTIWYFIMWKFFWINLNEKFQSILLKLDQKTKYATIVFKKRFHCSHPMRASLYHNDLTLSHTVPHRAEKRISLYWQTVPVKKHSV